MSKQVYLLGVGIALIGLGLAITDRAVRRPCPNLTRQVFERLQMGMIRAEVESILGPPTGWGRVRMIGKGGRLQRPLGPATLWERGGNQIAVWFDEGEQVRFRSGSFTSQQEPGPLDRLRAWLGL
jgi:hypothetical protein